MPRLVSPAVRELLDASFCESHDTVDIILPLKPGQTEADRISYYVAAADGVSYNSNYYLPMVRSFGAIRFSLGRSTDGMDITIENVSRTFGASISDSARKLEGAKVVVRRAFKTGPGVYEPVDLLHGSIKTAKINQEVVTVSIVSDMSRRGSQVASRVATQRCLWTYRGPECGWTPDQPGDPLFCNKTYTHALGCSGHGNQPRYGGVPTLSPAARALVGDDGNGWLPNGPITLGPWWMNPDYNFNGQYGNYLPYGALQIS